jgi:hypothetical protein
MGASSCVDNRYASPPPPVHVGPSDLHGTWIGWGGSSLTLRPDGVAEVANLDGQEFRFDEGWRMTGVGTWSLSEPGSYKGGNTVGDDSVVRVSVKRSVTKDDQRAEKTDPPSPLVSLLPEEAAMRTAPLPPGATWILGVTKGKAGQLGLFFLTSDPDLRDTYYLSPENK